MDLYITEKDTGTRVALSLLPDNVAIKGDSNTISYNFISVGEVKFPSGQKLKRYSWKGVFPGESRQDLSFIKKQHWIAPKELIGIFETWKEKATKLTLLLTETTLNVDVYLLTFNYDFEGGNGDVFYSVSFIEAKDPIVYTTTEAKTKQSSVSSNISAGSRPKSKTDTSTNSEQTRVHTVKQHENLWSIAEKKLGNGADYMKIYELNKDAIGSDPNVIPVGIDLVLPY